MISEKNAPRGDATAEAFAELRRAVHAALETYSNVLGVFNDLAAISGIVHRYGARLLVDAAQLVAHRPVDMEARGIDYLAFSAHKVYAPFGSGALVARKGLLRFSPEELALIRSSGGPGGQGQPGAGGHQALALAPRCLTAGLLECALSRARPLGQVPFRIELGPGGKDPGRSGSLMRTASTIGYGLRDS